MMQTYTCPTCNEQMERDLTLFTEHTDRHIVDVLKKDRPSWITEEGYCPKCLEYFKQSIQDPSAAEAMESVNIGPREVQKRYVLAAIGIGVGLLMLYGIQMTALSRAWRLVVFLPFFAGAMGYFQAKKKLCVIYARKAVRNMDHGEQAIGNSKEADRLRQKAAHVWLLSMVAAALLTAVCYGV